MRSRIWARLERKPVRVVTVLSMMGCIPGFAVGVVWGFVTGQWAMVVSMYAAWLIGGLACVPTALETERERSTADD